MKPSANDTSRRQEIRQFLMARRAAISPETAGLPRGLRRRTPGLRREELAALAGIGATWYTWFEQGRDIRVSAQALKRIAEALRLTSSDTAYLFSMCGLPLDEKVREPSGPAGYPQDVLDGFRAGPALLVSGCFDVLAYNELADLVFDLGDQSGPFARNHVWRFFMDPRRRERYLDWEFLAERTAATLRLLSARMIGDPHVEALVRELREHSPDFRRFWGAQCTMQLEPIKFAMQLPQFGIVNFTTMRFRSCSSPDQILVLLPPADAQSARVMEQLAAGEAKREDREPQRGSPRSRKKTRATGRRPGIA
jgi:transcriptional regulator with XRE-family HTH domain